MKLENMVAVITGAGAGIGKHIALEFAKEGAKTVVSSRREINGRPVADMIQQENYEACFIKCDVSIEQDVKVLIDKTIEMYGRIDILVNNAGVNFVRPFSMVSPSDWDNVINTDLRGTYLCAWYAMPHMEKQGKGSIINITTVHTMACLPGAAPYDAAKWGVVGFTKSLAVEYATKNIRVNALSPGLIDTQIWQDIKDAAPDLNECLDYWKANIPMGRVGTPDEIAKAAVFLASDDSSYITGTNLFADGGMTSQLVSRAAFESKDLKGGKR